MTPPQSIEAAINQAVEALKEMPSPKMQTCLAPEWYVKHYAVIKEALTALQSVRPRSEKEMVALVAKALKNSGRTCDEDTWPTVMAKEAIYALKKEGCL